MSDMELAMSLIKSIKREVQNNFSSDVDITSLKQVSSNQCTNKVQKSSLITEKTEWLTSKEAAEFLRISEGTLRNMASNGQIPYVKLGRSNRYNCHELNLMLLSKKRGSYGN